MTTTVRVGGVPEHFNLAWHHAIEKGAFARAGFNVEWQDIPGGTGAMCKALRNGELDIAIALTEGMIADIANGNPSRIVQFYVNSPLRWGIFVSAKSDIQNIEQMSRKRYAISRYQSGSHLMAYVNARQYQLNISEDDFVVVGNLDGARKALASGDAELFMWEKFTTKPMVDSGEFRMIGECKSPWPCFVLAMHNQFIERHANQLDEILNIINLYCWMMKNDAQAPHEIASRYGIKHDDAMQWFKELEYACSPEIDTHEFQAIIQELLSLNILNKPITPADVCYLPHLQLA
jgi:ABC-type nitrate/sulfonate/bicarbonate transport system substrate-binding protein